MYGGEMELKNLFTRIASIMLFFVLFFNVYSVVSVFGDNLVSLFPWVIWLECVTDIVCSFFYFLSFLLPALLFYGMSSKGKALPINFSWKLPSPHPFLKTASILFVSIGTIIAMAYLNSRIVPSFSGAGSMGQITKPYQLVLLMFSGAVIPAFSEELLFRGVILENVKPCGKGVAVLTSALLFGIMHMNLSQLLYATAAGVVLGIVYVATDSLWLCILIHFANNLFNLLESYMFGIFNDLLAEQICVLAELLIFTLGILFALSYVLTRKKDQKVNWNIGVFGEARRAEGCPLTEGNLVARAFFCPVMIVYLVIAALNMLSSFVLQALMI